MFGVLDGAVVFCRARFAKASRMDEPLGAAGAAGGAEDIELPCREASKLGGGLPGGVVDSSKITNKLETSSVTQQNAMVGTTFSGQASKWEHTWWWSSELLFEGFNHWRWEGLAFLPDINEFLYLLLLRHGYVSCGS